MSLPTLELATDIHPYALEAPSDSLLMSTALLAERLLADHTQERAEQQTKLDGLNRFVSGLVVDRLDRQTYRGPRNYSLICSTMFNPDTGEVCVVTKDPFVHSADPTDWRVVIYDIHDGKTREMGVQEARTSPSEDGDEVQLMLSVDDRADIGSYYLNFRVNSLYASSSMSTLTHPKYYGRGTGVEPEHMIDAVFPVDLSYLFGALDDARQYYVGEQASTRPISAESCLALGYSSLN